ncbi:ATP-binding cassette subfamily B multidrug efflux pump [Kitasatospora sp. GAS204A]|uniref:ABC transporter ATP-binding protein n=2 Tax=Kitasatospora TaxID=2063 RepID=UPI003517D7F8
MTARPQDHRRQLLGLLRPELPAVLGSLVLAAASVALSVLATRLLGRVTDLIAAGLLGRSLPAGPTKAQVIEVLRQRGQGRLADLLAPLRVVPGHGVDFTALAHLLLWALVVYAVAALLGVLQGRLAARTIQRTARRLRAEVAAKLSRLPLSYFDRQTRGEVLSRATNDIDNLAQAFQQTIGQLVTSALGLAAALVMMVWISWLLALVALVTVPAAAYLATAVGRRARPQFAAQWAATGRLSSHVEEMYTGHGVVRAFGRRDESLLAFEEQNEELYRTGLKAQFISGIIQPAMMFIGNLNYVAVAVVGGLRVAGGALSIGDVQAFIQYSRQFSQPLTQIAGTSTLVQSALASAERVFELLDAEEQSAEPERPERPAELRGLVSFEDVAFRYDPDKPLIEDLSLKVEPGQTVAIVGPTGAGKTTMVNLLMRFYEVTGGRITLDGVDIAAMSREELRAGIGMVLQDTWLFGGTIADNIAYGATHATREQVIEAAKAAHVDRFVRTLPEGYDTVIDDEGTGVSAGEKQLITIARAFLAQPSILVLDEATSSVDTRTEVLIQRAMALLRTGRTSFVIAHRLSTIRDADVILVMENGSIVEQGSHDDLIATEGAYARLYQAQFAQAVAAPPSVGPRPGADAQPRGRRASTVAP